MKKFSAFCNDVIKFLESEYNDSYRFEIKRFVALPGNLITGNNEKAELTIKFNRCCSLIIVNENMQYLFGRYRDGEYIGERNKYRWQKELIDMIEGGWSCGTSKVFWGPYSQLHTANLILPDGTFILVTECPGYKSWFGLKPTRLKVGDGKTEFNKLKFI